MVTTTIITPSTATWRCCLILVTSMVVIVPAEHLAENEIDKSSHKSTARYYNNNGKLPASEIHDEVDIIRLINVSDKDQGVSLVEGPISKYPAYKFRLPYGNVPVRNSTVVTRAMNTSSGFTIVFLYRQQKNNLGTLMSVHSPGRLTPWLQLTSNSKTGILTFKYRLQGLNKLKQIEWGLPRYHRKLPLAAWTWLSVSVDYTSDVVRLDLDCEPSRFNSLAAIALSNHHHIIDESDKHNNQIRFPMDSLVYFRQEPGRKKKFLGSMQVAKILPYVTHDRLWTCVEISPNLSAEFRKPLV